ncbi:MAG: HTH domain-containing protein [Candidatus Hodarchaeales archaeon]
MKTRREQIIELLEEHSMSIQELADLLHVSSKTIAQDLESVRKTIRLDGKHIEVQPATCIVCNYAFTGRNRISDPHKCPKCHSERINPQNFRIKTD